MRPPLGAQTWERSDENFPAEVHRIHSGALVLWEVQNSVDRFESLSQLVADAL